jgi:hypothetical protein
MQALFSIAVSLSTTLQYVLEKDSASRKFKTDQGLRSSLLQISGGTSIATSILQLKVSCENG